MNRFFLTLLMFATIFSAACSKLDPSSNKSKREGVTEQPTEVSGGFGLTMECTVLNKNVENAPSTQIGCVVNNDDGTKFTGKMEKLKAKVAGKAGKGQFESAPVIMPSDSSISVSVIIPGLSPDDAASIRVEGYFDSVYEKLSAGLYDNFSTVCYDDVTYWVDAKASDDEASCTKDKPCKTISKAVAILPDVIACKAIIEIAPGEYPEQVKLENKSIRGIGSSLEIRGDPLRISDSLLVKIVPPPNDPSYDNCAASLSYETEEESGCRFAFSIQNFIGPDESTSGGSFKGLKISNLTIEGGFLPDELPNHSDPLKNPLKLRKRFDVGIFTKYSLVYLSNLNFKGFPVAALSASTSPFVFLENIRVTESRAAYVARNIDKLKLTGFISGTGHTLGGQRGFSVKDTDILIDNAEIIMNSFVNGVLLHSSSLSRTSSGAKIVESPSPGVNAPIFNFKMALSNNDHGLSLLSNSNFNVQTSPLNKIGASINIEGCKLSCLRVRTGSSFSFVNKEAINDFNLILKSSLPSKDSPNNQLIFIEDAALVWIRFVSNDWCSQSQGAIRMSNASRFFLDRIMETTSAFSTCNKTQWVLNYQDIDVKSQCPFGFEEFEIPPDYFDTGLKGKRVCLAGSGYFRIFSYYDKDDKTPEVKYVNPIERLNVLPPDNNPPNM